MQSGFLIVLRLLEKERFSDSNLLVLKLNVSKNKIALLYLKMLLLFTNSWFYSHINIYKF